MTVPVSDLPTVVVLGDVTVNRLQLNMSSLLHGDEGQYLPAAKDQDGYAGLYYMGGGAWFLARLMREALRDKATVVTFDFPGGQSLRTCSTHDRIHSVSHLDRFPFKQTDGSEKNIYRVRPRQPFFGPTHGVPNLTPKLPALTATDEAKLKALVIDDLNHGFVRERANLNAVQDGDSCTPIILFSSCLPHENDWDEFLRCHKRAVAVVSADLIRSSGVLLSRRVSWELTVEHLVNEINRSDSILRVLCKFRHVVIRFSYLGAVHFENPTNQPTDQRMDLYYVPRLSDDVFRDDNRDGTMFNLNSVLVCSLVKAMLMAGATPEESKRWIGEGIKCGLNACRRFYLTGYGKDQSDVKKLACPSDHESSMPEPPLEGSPWDRAAVFEGKTAWTNIADVNVDIKANLRNWSIIESKKDDRSDLNVIAMNILQQGLTFLEKQASFPVAYFGDLIAVTRPEMESYREISNVIQAYVANERQAEPLSIAVFGQPGAGKSFGVKEVAKGIKNLELEHLSFNLAQFSKPEDLAIALLRVRDASVVKKLPLVFFDEFDAPLSATPLGWLRYFLAPMEDGQFKHGESMLRVGRAIFVFAGGLNHTYAAFDPIYGDQPIQNANTVEWQARKMRFDEAKGTDFVSRLRGHVNILGPNKTVQADQTFVVRRAIMLRHFLKQFGFVDEGTDRPKADLSVLRALLGTKYYKHGARSMRAILGMSMPIKGRLEKASLPTATQLDMHLHSADLLRRIRESNWSAEEEVTRTIPYPLSYPIQVASTVQAYELA